MNRPDLGELRAPLLEAITELWRDSGKVTPLRTRGISMRPLIREQDEVSIKHVGAEQIRVGDVAAFRSATVVIVHRVLAVENHAGKRVFVEKGDNTMQASRVNEDLLLGRVTTLKPAGRASFDLTRLRWRLLGHLAALHGRIVLPLASFGRAAGARLFGRRGGGAPDWFVRALHGGLLLPLRGLLTVARRLF